MFGLGKHDQPAVGTTDRVARIVATLEALEVGEVAFFGNVESTSGDFVEAGINPDGSFYIAAPAEDQYSDAGRTTLTRGGLQSTESGVARENITDGVPEVAQLIEDLLEGLGDWSAEFSIDVSVR